MTSNSSENDRDFDAAHRKEVRIWELNQVVRYFSPGARVLEIGAGAGWQARQLADRGFSVTAIDIPQSRYHQLQEWPVIDYDGFRIPLEDKSVDVLFSSNVLEHIPHIDQFMIEMRRVLREGGIGVHVMPTTLWRFVTCVTFYIQRLKHVIRRFLPKKKISKPSSNTDAIRSENYPDAPRGLVAKLRRALWPTLHGARGTVLTEHYYFSNHFWSNTFTGGGWQVQATEGAGLLYSGYRVFGHTVPLSVRRLLAKLVGSSCRIYIVRAER